MNLGSRQRCKKLRIDLFMWFLKDYKLVFLGLVWEWIIMINLLKLYKRWARTLTFRRLFIGTSRKISSPHLPTIAVWSVGARWTILKFCRTRSTFKRILLPSPRSMSSRLCSRRKTQLTGQRTNSSNLFLLCLKSMMRKVPILARKHPVLLWPQRITNRKLKW